MADFSVELDELKKIAVPEGPLDKAVSDIRGAIRDFNAADDLSQSAMSGTACGEVRAAWTEMHMFLGRVLERNRDTLELGQEAILEIVRRYRVLEGE